MCVCVWGGVARGGMIETMTSGMSGESRENKKREGERGSVGRGDGRGGG